SDDDVRKLVYLPTDAVLRPDVSGSAAGEARLGAYDAAFSRIKPSQLYATGVATPFATVNDVEQVLRDEPVHIVVVPGIFGEFIPRTPFEELFSTDSLSRSDWEVKGAQVTDDRFNVKTLETESLPLRDLVRVGSIDGAGPSGEKKALVTV